MVDPIGTTVLRRSLDSGPWRLTYNTSVKGDVPDHLPREGELGYSSVPGSVPGCVEIDLMDAGRLPDLYVGENVRAAWALEYGDWWYSTEFTLEPQEIGGLAVVFLGLDTYADVFLNGQLVGRADNMLIEHEFALADLAGAGTNTLVVHLTSPLRRAEQFDYPPLVTQVEGSYESLWVRKAAHMYGWDIAPRIVSAGLHRGVRLVQRAPDRLRDFHLRTVRVDPDYGSATLELSYQLVSAPRGRDVVVHLEAVEPGSGSTFAATVEAGFLAGAVRVEVPRAALWWPRGHGAAALYDVRLSLVIDGAVVDEHRWRHGIRDVRLDVVPLPAPDGRFAVCVNGVHVMVMGTNWVQLDALHARDEQRLGPALALLDESRCNTVRCWGGNVYESDAFFDWCDQHGVLVWQDFALACARYPQEESFCSAIGAEATSVVKRLRRHASLALWSGSNEDDENYIDAGLDPDADVITRRVLPEVVGLHDPGRAYILGSPSFPGILARLGRSGPPEQHLWGDRAWFKDPYYAASTARFVSEIGFHGSPSSTSLARFIPDLGDVIEADAPVWALHETRHAERRPVPRGNRTQLMVDQANLMFGDGVGTALTRFVPASQIAQAEALKFVVEHARLDPRRDGVIWWNLLDCWPQTSDAVVDYYFEPKLAFHYLRRAQEPVCLVVDEAQGWWHDVVLLVDGRAEGAITYVVRSLRSGDVVLSGTEPAIHEGRRRLGRVPRASGPEDCFLIEWEVQGRTYRNHYLSGTPAFDLDTYVDVFLPAIAAGPDGWTSRPL